MAGIRAHCYPQNKLWPSDPGPCGRQTFCLIEDTITRFAPISFSLLVLSSSLPLSKTKFVLVKPNSSFKKKRNRTLLTLRIHKPAFTAFALRYFSNNPIDHTQESSPPKELRKAQMRKHTSSYTTSICCTAGDHISRYTQSKFAHITTSKPFTSLTFAHLRNVPTKEDTAHPLKPKQTPPNKLRGRHPQFAASILLQNTCLHAQ
eukprot:c23160_g2_i2 orf=221-832(-)